MTWLASGAEPFRALPAAPKARVVVVEDREAIASFQPDLDRVQAMIVRGLTNLTGQPTASAAWLSLVSTQDIVGLKVYSLPGAISGTRPAVAEAVARGLIAAGLPPTNIIIWDRSEIDLRLAGFFEIAQRLGVRVEASARSGYDAEVYYENPIIGSLIWGDLEFDRTGEGVGKRSYVSKLVSQQMTRIISLAPLLNHYAAGVSGHLYGLALGSVDNTVRFEGNPGRLAQAVPEIYALPVIADRVVLNITDALISQYEGGQKGLLHYSTVLYQLRFSFDPVALDVLSLRDLDRQRRSSRGPNVRPNLELYRNAALLELGISDPQRIQVEK